MSTVMMKSKLRSRFQRGEESYLLLVEGDNNEDVAFNIEDEGEASRCVTPTATNIVKSTTNNIYTLNLQDYPEIHTPNEGNITVSTMTNDGAFSQRRLNCGFDFDFDERSVMRGQRLNLNRNISSDSSSTNNDEAFSQKRINSVHSDKRFQMREQKNQGFTPNSTLNPDLPSLSSTTSSSQPQVHLMACGLSESLSVDSNDSIFDRVLEEEIKRLNAMGKNLVEI